MFEYYVRRSRAATTACRGCRRGGDRSGTGCGAGAPLRRARERRLIGTLRAAVREAPNPPDAPWSAGRLAGSDPRDPGRRRQARLLMRLWAGRWANPPGLFTTWGRRCEFLARRPQTRAGATARRAGACGRKLLAPIVATASGAPARRTAPARIIPFDPGSAPRKENGRCPFR
jgi:hypothetical protein